jgi:hypothetical protein
VQKGLQLLLLRQRRRCRLVSCFTGILPLNFYFSAEV